MSAFLPSDSARLEDHPDGRFAGPAEGDMQPRHAPTRQMRRCTWALMSTITECGEGGRIPLGGN